MCKRASQKRVHVGCDGSSYSREIGGSLGGFARPLALGDLEGPWEA